MYSAAPYRAVEDRGYPRRPSHETFKFNCIYQAIGGWEVLFVPRTYRRCREGDEKCFFGLDYSSPERRRGRDSRNVGPSRASFVKGVQGP